MTSLMSGVHLQSLLSFYFIWIYPLKGKSDFCEIFKKNHIMIEKELRYKIKQFQLDYGGEYIALPPISLPLTFNTSLLVSTFTSRVEHPKGRFTT